MSQLEFENISNSKKYIFKAICNNMIYAKELKSKHFLGLYYLFFQKDYSKEKNIKKLVLVLQHF